MKRYIAIIGAALLLLSISIPVASAAQHRHHQTPLVCGEGTHRNGHECRANYVPPVVVVGPEGPAGPAGPAGTPASTTGFVTTKQLEEYVFQAIRFCEAHPGFANICNELPPEEGGTE